MFVDEQGLNDKKIFFAKSHDCIITIVRTVIILCYQ